MDLIGEGGDGAVNHTESDDGGDDDDAGQGADDVVRKL
jgi:hypothetical protein